MTGCSERKMQRSRIERYRGCWVTVRLVNGRTYTGFLRRLKRETSWQMYCCGSSGPFTAANVVRVDEVGV